MSDVENTSNENVDAELPQYTEIEEQALSQGWRPKDEYNGDPSKWVNADIYVARAPLFEHIESQKRELKKLRDGLNVVNSHYKKIEEVSYKKALADLRAEKKKALEDMDADAVINIDERIDLVKEQQLQGMRTPDPVAEPNQIHPEFQAWTSRNNWYTQDQSMRAFADALGRDLAGTHSPSQVLIEVEKTIKQRFPEKFSNPNREKPGAVEAPRGKGTSTAAKPKYDLSDEERQVMRTLVRSGVLTEEQYVKDLKKIKEAE